MDQQDIKKLFNGRKAVIATMHKKEEVIAPILERELGISTVVPTNFNTDSFGTFTNEVKRTGDQLEAAKVKAEKAMDLTGLQIGISSEGSFGPHPIIPFISFNRELILFIDKKQQLEITGYAANSDTNYAQTTVGSFDEAYEFAQSIGFPEHGVILKKSAETTERDEIVKGITSLEKLKDVLTQFIKKSPTIFIETDMRAMYNPTRMKNIEKATLDLISKINSLCPSCSTPGYEVKEVKKGLECEYCGFPTELILSNIYGCKKCDHEEEILYPNGKEKADPSQCNICNP